MKILYFGGGLGNQIFEYSFYLSVKDKFPNERIFGVYDKKRFKEHAGGFEAEKIFGIKYPPSNTFANVAMFLIMVWNKVIHKTSLYCHNLTSPNYSAVLFNAHKMNKSFYENRENWIAFKPIKLNSLNKMCIKTLKESESVSLHVRRGDFLSEKYAAKHAGVADEQYYNHALSLIKQKVANPKFFVFSDDIPWCKEHFSLPNVTYVDWNTGEESYIDMYLMTNAKHCIIANSTFSYWGAYLNDNNPTVIYPAKWKSSESKGCLDIFPNSWIGID